MSAQPISSEASQSETFANPTRFCDLVMKGGITSGVIYPSAVCELARDYNFKNIGGASAGAIAAATTAALKGARCDPEEPSARMALARLAMHAHQGARHDLGATEPQAPVDARV